MRGARSCVVLLMGVCVGAAGCGKVTATADAARTVDAARTADAAAADAPTADARPADARPADARPADARPADAMVTLPPTLQSLSPTSGIVTTHVTLTGSHFGATQGTGSVSIGGMSAAIVSWSDTSVVATVPLLFPGAVNVTLTTSAGTAGPLTFNVILPPTVYVNNNIAEADGFDSISVLSFNPSTGALTAMGSPVSMGLPTPAYGGCSTSAIVHVPTRRLFASGSTGVAVFNIDPVTGALTPVSGSPFVFNTTQAYGLAINQAGTMLFVADFSGHVAVATVGSTGALTQVSGSPFATNGNDDTVVLSPNEKFLYVNQEKSSFEGYSIASNGTITALTGSPFAATSAFGAGGRPGHPQLYIPNSSSMMGVWNLDPTTGAPTPITGSPFTFTVPGGIFHYPAFTSDGNRLYVGTFSSGYVFGFTLDAAGTPTAISGSPWNFTASFTDISCVAVSKDAAHLILLGENQHTVGSFALDANGVPTQVTGSPFANQSTGSNASGLAITF